MALKTAGCCVTGKPKFQTNGNWGSDGGFGELAEFYISS